MFNDYIEQVIKTENTDFQGIKERISNSITIRIMHSICGIANESGELMENFKKHIFYGAELSKENLVEEYGDLLWYIAIGLDVLGISFEEVMQKNIEKLRVRYTQELKWEKDLAITRDLSAEKKCFASKVSKK